MTPPLTQIMRKIINEKPELAVTHAAAFLEEYRSARRDYLNVVRTPDAKAEELFCYNRLEEFYYRVRRATQ